MITRTTPLPSLLLSVLLLAPATSAWSVPSFNAPLQSSHGATCQVTEQQTAHKPPQDQNVSLERMQSPCRLEDAQTQKGMHINEGQEDPAEILRQVADWEGLNRHAPSLEEGPGLLHQPSGHSSSTASATATPLDITTPPVPEPANYAMLLGGLALIAALGRRRAPPAARR